MNKKNKTILTMMLVLSCAAFTACSSKVTKFDIPSTANPQQEITKFDEALSKAVSENIDVLAPGEYKSAVKQRDEAKSDLASGEKQEEVLDDVRLGRGYLLKAYDVSENRAAKAPGVFSARQHALKAGAGARPELVKDLKELDSDVSDKADSLAKVSADKLSKFQERYIEMERRAVVLNQLGNAQAMVNGAKDDNASKYAPVSYKKAELSLKNAESVISTNVRNPEGFAAAVATANHDSVYLNDVMNTIKQNKNLSETAALKMVAQTRQIKGLKTDLSTSAAASAAAQGDLEKKNEELSSDLATKSQNLSSAQASVELQQMLEKARSQFSPDEAEAYQQGDSLLIRMKKMNFASGRSDLPADSLASLAKVTEVAKSLNAAEIKVEGHTDSIGGESQNMSISEKRANSVATYFKTNGFDSIEVQASGYGFKKPIATNKSKEGRALNRRVDIVITPSVQR